MRLQRLKTKILLAMASLLVSSISVSVVHAHGGGGTYVTHHYGNPHHHVTRHVQVHMQRKKHYHPATAYVPAEYHAHPFSYPFHRHYYWKTTSHVYNTHHH